MGLAAGLTEATGLKFYTYFIITTCKMEFAAALGPDLDMCKFTDWIYSPVQCIMKSSMAKLAVHALH